MFCPKCGSKIEDGEDFCRNCGYDFLAENNNKNYNNNNYNNNYNINNENNNRSYSTNLNPKDSPNGNVWLNILGFFSTIAGLVLYIVLRNEDPIVAKNTIKWTVIGIIAKPLVGLLIYLIYFIIAAIILGIGVGVTGGAAANGIIMLFL